MMPSKVRRRRDPTGVQQDYLVIRGGARRLQAHGPARPRGMSAFLSLPHLPASDRDAALLLRQHLRAKGHEKQRDADEQYQRDQELPYGWLFYEVHFGDNLPILLSRLGSTQK